MYTHLCCRCPSELHDIVVFYKRRETVRRNYASIIGHLADQGADVDLGRNDGYTPLQVAAEYGHVETLRTLLEKSGDVSKTVSVRGGGGGRSVCRL